MNLGKQIAFVIAVISAATFNFSLSAFANTATVTVTEIQLDSIPKYTSRGRPWDGNSPTRNPDVYA